MVHYDTSRQQIERHDKLESIHPAHHWSCLGLKKNFLRYLELILIVTTMQLYSSEQIKMCHKF